MVFALIAVAIILIAIMVVVKSLSDRMYLLEKEFELLVNKFNRRRWACDKKNRSK